VVVTVLVVVVHVKRERRKNQEVGWGCGMAMREAGRGFISLYNLPIFNF
jgi:hypothetical protein